MEKLREKRVEMMKRLEEFEEREMAANKKLARSNEAIAKFKNDSENLRSRCRVTEGELDKTEDSLEENLEKLVTERKRAEREYFRVKSLEEKEIEVDYELEKIEPRVKEAMKRQDDTEMKLREVESKLTLTRCELHKINARKIDKEEQVRELNNRVKVGGRSIQQLVISEEKYGDKEDDYRYKIKILQAKISNTIMRAEETERRARRLERERNMLDEEVTTYRKNYNMMQEKFEDTLNFIDCV